MESGRQRFVEHCMETIQSPLGGCAPIGHTWIFDPERTEVIDDIPLAVLSFTCSGCGAVRKFVGVAQGKDITPEGNAHMRDLRPQY